MTKSVQKLDKMYASRTVASRCAYRDQFPGWLGLTAIAWNILGCFLMRVSYAYGANGAVGRPADRFSES